MTNPVLYVPIAWQEILRTPDRELRRTLASRARSAAVDSTTAARRNQKNAWAARRTAARRKGRAFAVIAARHIDPEDAAVLATIDRCSDCEVWTCAPAFQRVPHTCKRVERGVA